MSNQLNIYKLYVQRSLKGEITRNVKLFTDRQLSVRIIEIPDLERSDLVYEFSCPGCSARYIGKTVRNSHTRLAEQAKFNNISAISEHLM